MKKSIIIGVAVGLLVCLLVAFLLALLVWSQWDKLIYQTSVAVTAQAEATPAISAESTDQAEAGQPEAQLSEAQRQQAMAESRTLAAHAESVIDEDPQLAILLGLEAVYRTHRDMPDTVTEEASSALYRAIARSRWQATLHNGHVDQIRRVAWSSDGTRIVTASLDGSAKVWDAQTGAVIFTLSGYAGQVWHAAWNSDSTRIVTTHGDGSVKVWDAQTGAVIFTLSGHTSDVMHAAWSSDDTRIVTASDDKTAKVWDVQTGKELFTLSGHTSEVRYAAWNSNDTRIVTTSRDKSARVWDAQTGAELSILSGHRYGIWHAAWNPDDTRIVTASEDGSAKVWDAQTGKELFTLSMNECNGNDWCIVSHSAWNSDGTRIATASLDGTAKVWDAQTGKELFTLGKQIGEEGWIGPVWHVAWSPDDMRIITVGGGTINRVWDAQTGAELFTLSGHRHGVWHTAWSPDGTHIVTAGSDGNAIVWNAQVDMEILTPSFARVDDLIEFACTRTGRNMTHDEWRLYMGGEPYLQTCPNLPAHSSVIEELIRQGITHYDQGDLEAALADYTSAFQLAIATNYAGFNNDVCWFGSIDGFVEIVMPACERAVELAPYDGRFRDSRGLARALTGNYAGAIEDFESFVEWTKKHSKYGQNSIKREDWIAKLKAGQNPFDSATLKALRNEGL
jgi:WD40 repeat protein